MTPIPTGIAALGLSFPSLYLDVRTLAQLRGVDPDKYVLGLGCERIAWCAPDENVVTLATRAAQRALEQWTGKLEDIGLIVVGTESGIDMSRPLSAWVAENIGLQGNVRSYEVKHACYGGTLGLRQAVEWRLSDNARGKAALVIAADVGKYAAKDPGEPTQGAGAVAMIIAEPRIATIHPYSYFYSEPAFDFWRPISHAYPLVEGAYSLECYQRATVQCYQQWLADSLAPFSFSEISAACFHVPFPKMVKKAVHALGQSLQWDSEQTENFYQQKVDFTMWWNRLSGNSYTASLWTAVSYTLARMAAGHHIAAFSYGSGFGAELLLLTAGEAAAKGAWEAAAEADFCRQRALSAEEYQQIRQSEMPSI